MRDKILNTAGKMFLELGFKSVTMDDIAHELAVSKKTIYKYFSNKHSLVEESTSQIHESCMKIIDSIIDKNFSAIKENLEIKKMFKEMFKNLGNSPLYQLKKYYPKIYENITSNEINTFSDSIKKNIEKGIKEGFYRKDLNIEVSVGFYLSIIFGIHQKDISKTTSLALEQEALLYHTRAIATVKGLQELEKQLNNQ